MFVGNLEEDAISVYCNCVLNQGGKQTVLMLMGFEWLTLYYVLDFICGSYRTNYFMLIIVILGLGFLRRPLAIVAAALTALTIAFLNDSFAGTFSEKVTRTVRQFSPHLAAKMRPPLTPVIRGRPSAKRAIYICGRRRWVFVLLFSALSFFLWFVSCGLLTVLWAFSIGLLATVLHASFRTPNLKARLNTFREEFRAVWRNYSEI
ncbi:PRA1 family protein A3 [Bienertia sinuspersici]